MASDLLVYGAIAAVMGTSLAVGFSLPALTVSSSGTTRSVEAQYEVSEQLNYCRAVLDGVDCGCFASRAGYLMSEKKPHAQGYHYMDSLTLARTQALKACRE